MWSMASYGDASLTRTAVTSVTNRDMSLAVLRDGRDTPLRGVTYVTPAGG